MSGLVWNFCADLSPGNLLLLHLVRNEAAVAILEGDLLDLIAAEQACQRNQVADGEVGDLRAVVHAEDWVPAGAEREEDDTAGPHIDRGCLLRAVE